MSFQVPYGVTVQLDHNGDRIESFSIMNYILTKDGKMSSNEVRFVILLPKNSTEVVLVFKQCFRRVGS